MARAWCGWALGANPWPCSGGMASALAVALAVARALAMDLWSSFIDIRLHRVGRVGIIMGNEVGIRMGNGVGIIMVGRI